MGLGGLALDSIPQALTSDSIAFGVAAIAEPHSENVLADGIVKLTCRLMHELRQSENEGSLVTIARAMFGPFFELAQITKEFPGRAFLVELVEV